MTSAVRAEPILVRTAQHGARRAVWRRRAAGAEHRRFCSRRTTRSCRSSAPGAGAAHPGWGGGGGGRGGGGRGRDWQLADQVDLAGNVADLFERSERGVPVQCGRTTGLFLGCMPARSWPLSGAGGFAGPRRRARPHAAGTGRAASDGRRGLYSSAAATAASLIPATGASRVDVLPALRSELTLGIEPLRDSPYEQDSQGVQAGTGAGDARERHRHAASEFPGVAPAV